MYVIILAAREKNKTILHDYAFSGRRLDRRSGQLSTRGRLPQGHYEVKVKVYDVVWKHEVISMVTVVVKEIDDVAIANAGSLRIQGTFAHVKNLVFLPFYVLGFFGFRFQQRGQENTTRTHS